MKNINPNLIPRSLYPPSSLQPSDQNNPSAAPADQTMSSSKLDLVIAGEANLADHEDDVESRVVQALNLEKLKILKGN